MTTPTATALDRHHAESRARVEARPRPTPRVLTLHAAARARFEEESDLGRLAAGAGEHAGYRLELPAWHAQHDWHPTRRRKGRPVKWRPVFDALSLNARVHHYVHGKATAIVRGWVELEAGPKRVALPEGDHLTVRLLYRPARAGARDASNLQGLQKALVDGLARGPQKTRTRRYKGHDIVEQVVGLDLVPDDCEPWLTEWPPTLLEPTSPGASGLWLDVLVRNPRGVL